MRTRIFIIALILVASGIPTAQSGSPEQMDEIGAVFGGVNIPAASSGNSTSSLSDLPAIVEDYTATWCTNCVKVEHALDDVEETNKVIDAIELIKKQAQNFSDANKNKITKYLQNLTKLSKLYDN